MADRVQGNIVLDHTQVLAGASAPAVNGTDPARDALLARSEARGEGAWMRRFREQAWNAAKAMPWPSLTDEAWRRTRLTGLDPDNFSYSPTHEGRVGEEALSPLLQAELNEMESDATLIFEDGLMHYRVGVAALEEQGVIFKPLDLAVQEHEDFLREHFMTRVVPVETDVFTALHGALWDSGTLIHVPRNTRVALPLQIINWQGEGQAGHHHTLVVAEEGTEVTVVDSLLGARRGFQNSVVEIVQAPGSRVRYMNLQDLDTSAWNLMHGRAHLNRDADLRWIQVSWGSMLTKAFLDLVLQGPGGHADLLGIYFPTGRQHIDHQTLQLHEAPHCFSDLLFNGALKDRARSVYMGNIRVTPEAQQTDAFQRNGNLLLDSRTRADSIPGLEIEANDVRCTHAATAAQVEDEYVFYLMARGLSRPQAERLIVQGFFQAVLARVPVESVVHKLEQVIERKIGG